MAFGRARQVNKQGAAASFREKLRQKKNRGETR